MIPLLPNFLYYSFTPLLFVKMTETPRLNAGAFRLPKSIIIQTFQTHSASPCGLYVARAMVCFPFLCFSLTMSTVLFPSYARFLGTILHNAYQKNRTQTAASGFSISEPISQCAEVKQIQNVSIRLPTLPPSSTPQPSCCRCGRSPQQEMLPSPRGYGCRPPL